MYRWTAEVLHCQPVKIDLFSCEVVHLFNKLKIAHIYTEHREYTHKSYGKSSIADIFFWRNAVWFFFLLYRLWNWKTWLKIKYALESLRGGLHGFECMRCEQFCCYGNAFWHRSNIFLLRFFLVEKALTHLFRFLYISAYCFFKHQLLDGVFGRSFNTILFLNLLEMNMGYDKSYTF